MQSRLSTATSLIKTRKEYNNGTSNLPYRKKKKLNRRTNQWGIKGEVYLLAITHTFTPRFWDNEFISMEKKDKITQKINEIKSDPARWKNLRDFATSKLTEEQKSSPVFESILSLKMRQVLCEYFE